MRFQIQRQSHHNAISTSLPDFSTILLNRIRDSRNNATTAMASSISTAVIFPLGFRNSFQNQAVRTVRLSPFAMKISHNLSFTRCVSGFAPTVVQRVPIVASPSRNNPKPLTIVAAKGYKMKTHKASAKRFRVTGGGKIVRRRAGKQHLLRKKNAKRRLRLSKLVQVDRSDYNNVIGALPYLKVNRAN